MTSVSAARGGIPRTDAKARSAWTDSIERGGPLRRTAGRADMDPGSNHPRTSPLVRTCTKSSSRAPSARASLPPSRETSVAATGLRAALLALAVALLALPAGAQTAKPDASNAALNARLKAAAQPAPVKSPPLPKTAQHSAFTDTTNKKGQVVTAKAQTKARDSAFNLMTYGNVLQMFIRTSGGQAVPGTYRVSYDYSPASKIVKRAVALVQEGGVDPNALGAVDRMIEVDRKNAERAAAARKARRAAPSTAPGTR